MPIEFEISKHLVMCYYLYEPKNMFTNYFERLEIEKAFNFVQFEIFLKRIVPFSILQIEDHKTIIITCIFQISIHYSVSITLENCG